MLNIVPRSIPLTGGNDLRHFDERSKIRASHDRQGRTDRVQSSQRSQSRPLADCQEGGQKFGPSLRTAAERRHSRIREGRIQIPSAPGRAAQREGRVVATLLVTEVPCNPNCLRDLRIFRLEQALDLESSNKPSLRRAMSVRKTLQPAEAPGRGRAANGRVSQARKIGSL